MLKKKIINSKCQFPNLKTIKYTVNDYTTNEIYTIDFKIEEENRPQFKCSCNQKKQGLCEHQKNAWIYLKNEIDPFNFFNDSQLFFIVSSS